ncbi:MAG: beta-galactosidase [Verrucomicrobia bacterium]|nr:beta-galactosidase [Verrucomicrobiota bacterium]
MAIQAKAGESQQITSFERPEDITEFRTADVKVSQTSQGATEGSCALKIEFAEAEWPHALLEPAIPWNWKHFNGLALDVTNPGTEPLSFGIRIDDAKETHNGATNTRSGTGEALPERTETYLLPFTATPEPFGMKGLPPIASDMKPLKVFAPGEFDSSHICELRIFSHNPKARSQLIVDNIRLAHVPTIDMNGIVDAFGQYTRADWPDKIRDAGQLTATRDAETQQFAARPLLPERDGYGGWTSGPQLPGSGFFRTAKVKTGNGAHTWWLVDPDGYLFLSIGLNSVSLHESRTAITGRESMFAKLPEKDGPLSRHMIPYGNAFSAVVKNGMSYDFYAANVERKYGPGYRESWRDRTFQRMRAWGFNTAGGFSDLAMEFSSHTAYTLAIGARGEHQRISDGISGWRQMDDPFDPAFATQIEESVRSLKPETIRDPWLLGYFSGNEESWGDGRSGKTPRQHYGLAYGTLRKDATSPAKQALLSTLKRKYETIEKLNLAWRTTFENWGQLEKPVEATSSPPPAMTADFSAFLTEFALRYFSVVREAIRKVDPNHLYLGCRFARYTPEAVKAAAEVCDVVSFNIYETAIDEKWDFLKQIDRPCLVSEFHFGALDRGMFAEGLVAARDQRQRAEMYARYVESMAVHPDFVGCHWFQYVDQPTTGRLWDGENFNIGFVSITDTPYPELVESAREAHSRLYDLHFGPTPPFPK